jgi:carbonic anhydrase
MQDCRCGECQAINRREFLKYMLGATALTTTTLAGGSPAWAEKKPAKSPKALVLSCIDYRILEAERYFLSLQNLGNLYDMTALAGSSLALSGVPHQSDAMAFWDQLDISYRLHHIKKVIILDHQDCAAFAYKIDPQLATNPALEIKTHQEYLSRAHWAIRDKYPDLNIELYFVSLNTEVKSIEPLPRAPNPPNMDPKTIGPAPSSA